MALTKDRDLGTAKVSQFLSEYVTHRMSQTEGRDSKDVHSKEVQRPQSSRKEK